MAPPKLKIPELSEGLSAERESSTDDPEVGDLMAKQIGDNFILCQKAFKSAASRVDDDDDDQMQEPCVSAHHFAREHQREKPQREQWDVSHKQDVAKQLETYPYKIYRVRVPFIGEVLYMKGQKHLSKK